MHFYKTQLKRQIYLMKRQIYLMKERLDIERDSLPDQDIIQQTKAELFTFFLVSVYALSSLNDF